MTATSDTYPNTSSGIEEATALRNSLTCNTGVNHAGRIFFGTVLSLSAVGLWLVPVEGGDAGMQLIKLLVSIVMLLLGVMFIFSARARSEAPEIMIDTQNRELTIIERDAEGQISAQRVHQFDDMAEVTLRDRMFIARDASGEIIVSLPLPDKGSEKALKNALQLSV